MRSFSSLPIPDVPKAELHVHLEGTMSPALVRRLAARHGMALPETLFTLDDGFAWTDFVDFLRAYDVAASVVRTAADYRDITYDYLRRCHEDGAIYVEVMTSPDHAATAGLDYRGHLDGTARGIDEAKRDFGIEGRIIVTCVRHFGPDRALEVARQVVANSHPLVTGFGMGGDENQYQPSDFEPAFTLVHSEAGLPCTAHAGEAAGAESVRAVLDTLPVSRLGHGVRAIEDPALVSEIVDRGIVLEVCPTSNIRTGVYAHYAAHPFGKLLAAGCRVTLNSDDPPFFDASIGGEYAVGAAHFGLDESDLADITRTSLLGAFVDEETRSSLLDRL